MNNSWSPHFGELVSPLDHGPLAQLDSGTLMDASGHRFPVVGSIPRFVPVENYADSFGWQWQRFEKTQIDKYNGTTISRDRFYRSTGWKAEEILGQRVLEVGSGAGRFTQVLLDAGGRVYSVDYSSAVEANGRNNGPHPNLLLGQASVYNLPFRMDFFDKVLCLGMLQHTPDPAGAFRGMVPFLKPGGEIAVDSYARTGRTCFQSYRWYRPLTRRMNKGLLLALIRIITPLWWPFSTALLRLPKIGFFLSRLIPVVNHARFLPMLSRSQRREWAVLDTFDQLSPRYDQPVSLKEFRAWFESSNLSILHCGMGDNGCVGVGRRKG